MAGRVRGRGRTVLAFPSNTDGHKPLFPLSPVLGFSREGLRVSLVPSLLPQKLGGSDDRPARHHWEPPALRPLARLSFPEPVLFQPWLLQHKQALLSLQQPWPSDQRFLPTAAPPSARPSLSGRKELGKVPGAGGQISTWRKHCIFHL